MRLSKFIQGRRFINRRLRNLMPERYPFAIHSKLHIFLDARDLGGPSFFVAHGGPAAFYFYEERIKAEILANLPADGTFLDLGANIGIHTAFIANLFPLAHIYAFEPSESLNECLSATIVANGFGNVHLVPFAVGEEDSTREFWIDPKSSGGNSLIRESIGAHARRATRKVEVVALDSYIRRQRIEHVHIIKIDVQDAEDLVLSGAKNLIEGQAPVLIVESSNKRLSAGVGAVLRLPSGYRFKKAGEREFQPLKNLVEFAGSELAKGQEYSDYVFKGQFPESGS